MQFVFQGVHNEGPLGTLYIVLSQQETMTTVIHIPVLYVIKDSQGDTERVKNDT